MSTDVYSTGPTVVCSESIGLTTGVAAEYVVYASATNLNYKDNPLSSLSKSHSFENAYAHANVAGNAMYLTCKDVASVNTYTGSPNLAIECGYVQAIAGI